jgi:signal transduction histidine kinase
MDRTAMSLLSTSQSAPTPAGGSNTTTAPSDLAYLSRLVEDLLTAPDVGSARATLIERLGDATDARAVAIVSVDHARLRCRLDALIPSALRSGDEAQLPLRTPPLPGLLALPGPARLPAGVPIPWLVPAAEGTATLCAPLRRRTTVTGLIFLRLGPSADLVTAERLLATTAHVAALGLDAVRREDRDEFLAMVRHDIYNPMTVAMFHAEMLAEALGERGDRANADLALSVLSCLNAVCDLVSNFFYLEAIDEGAPAIHPETLDLMDLAREIVDTHRPSAATKQLVLELSGQCPPVQGDRRQLGRVLANLVGNALKYTPGPGTVDVELSADDHEARIRVQDSGAGMTPANLARLFQKHARFHQHLGIPGTGLGLYLAKAIVEAHGGTIEVESAPDEGSTFTVRLPRT